MDKTKLAKISGLNLGIAAVNTVVFSPGLLGFGFAGSPFGTAVAFTTIIMSLLIFAYGNYTLVMREQKAIIPVKDLTSPEDYTRALEQHSGKKAFGPSIDLIQEQIRQFGHKSRIIDDILRQNFDPEEMSYVKFHGTIAEVEKVFYLNIRSMLNRLNSFDEKDYRRITAKQTQSKLSPELIQSKLEVYNGYIAFVRQGIEDNEGIILKLDKILLELSRLDSLEPGELGKLSAMEEIDRLIKETKLYS